MNAMTLETVMDFDGGVTVTARLTSRRDMERFLAISDKLLELFPPELPPPPPDPKPGEFEPGDIPAPTVTTAHD